MPMTRADLEGRMADLLRQAMADGVDTDEIDTTLENLREEFCKDE